jgi:hypothetical protein
MEFAVMKANECNDHDAADILCGECKLVLCGECKLVVATLHARSNTEG